jgi:LuxR family maltose regulon positive regulatory protein
VTGSLLDTKLYAPRRRTDLVPRPQLTDRVDLGARSKLTLLSAPAGFGKSTLLAEWLGVAAGDGAITAWLSLDPGDNQPTTFWTNVIAALRTVAPMVGAKSLTLLEAPDRSIEAVLAPLLNELNALPHDVVLVLDDYHLVEGQEIQLGMEYLLEHLPPAMHVVIATRADPGLRLSRLRARGELVEIRAADLRFKPDETASYFNGVMGLHLSTADVAALERRTEGWIAALQLAGLSMQGRDDVGGFIAGFAGDDRYIVDYLVEEVLHRQPEAVRAFLLETSILERMCGPLCDAVTASRGGSATLEALDRGNLFLVSLDDRREWYRYHHLFGDVLRARLLAESPERVSELHRRASLWHEHAGDRPAAIRHALAGQDCARAADLVELAIPVTGRDRQEATLRRWLEALPDELIRDRPVLSNAYAGSILVRGGTEGVEARLRDAERWLATTDAAGTPDEVADGATSMVVVDREAFRRLPGMIAMHRAGLARLLGDVPGTIVHARRAGELFDDDDDLGQGAASTLLGLAYWTRADLEAATALYTASMARFEKVGHLSDAIGLALSLADMRIAQGRLHDAMRTYERGLELATRRGPTPLRGAADMHVGMSELLRERDDLAAAARHLEQARDLGEENGLPQNPYRSRVAAARIRQAEGDSDAALELLAEARRLYTTDFSPEVRPVEAMTARVWIAQGRLAEATGWARERGLSATDDLGYEREFEHITLARLLLARGARDRSESEIGHAIELLERLLRDAEAGGRTGSVIEILVVLALARRARNDAPGTLGALEHAVELAEPEGYVRVFADEGPPMAATLRQAAQRRTASDYLRRLLAATVTPASPAAPAHPLIEPLSERELDVLRLLDSELDGPGIARELTVSVATVRTHTRNVYAKLGVNNRRAAVRRAAELGLLASSRDGRAPH